MNITGQVICIKDCVSLGGAKFYNNKIYKCQLMNYTCYIFDENNQIIRLEIDNPFEKSKFSEFFTTLKNARKQKLNKILQNGK